MKSKKVSPVRRTTFDAKNFVFVGVIVIALAGTLWVVFGSKHATQQNTVNQPLAVATSTPVTAQIQAPCNFQRLLDGVCVNTQEEVNPPIVGVMVENSLDALPLSGVSQASIVYEAPAEGNIPRFLTIFPLDATVEKLGPVRSSRPYYIDWLSAYADVMYMHVGGSPEALEKIRAYQLFDMNEMFNGGAFWRSTNRLAPHNTYTSSDLWNTAHEKNIDEFKNDQYTAWKYEEKSSCTNDCVNEVPLAFSAAYKVVWKYNTETKLFERALNGRAQKDENGTAYSANNVILQHVQMTVLDEVGRKKITTIGEGKAELYIAGVKIDGTWKKKSRTEPTLWYDNQGNEVHLAPGKTWVEIIGTGMSPA